jgi:hypothetical protein
MVLLYEAQAAVQASHIVQTSHCLCSVPGLPAPHNALPLFCSKSGSTSALCTATVLLPVWQHKCTMHCRCSAPSLAAQVHYALPLFCFQSGSTNALCTAVVLLQFCQHKCKVFLQCTGWYKGTTVPIDTYSGAHTWLLSTANT